MLDYRVETFLVVCKEMNYTKAAELLNITQPNVSQHIKWLEDLYGQKLFTYQGRKLVLTAAGELLKKTVTAVRHEEKLLRQQMAVLKNEKKMLAFGVTKSLNEGVMKHKVEHFLEHYFGDRVRFTVDNTQNLLRDIREMRLDFAVVEGNFDKSLYDYKVLTKEAFIPVCGKDHVFGKHVNLIEDLFGETLIIREEGSGSRQILEKYLESRNDSFKSFSSVMEIGDIGVIKTLLQTGEGISFVYEKAVEQELKQGQLKKILLKDFSVCHEFAMVWMKTRQFSSYYKQMADEFMQEQVKKGE